MNRRALDQAIAQLEGLRESLGDKAVDTAIAELRRHTQAGAPQEQRLRQVSVLFADIAGSTAMLRTVGAEDATELISNALQSFANGVNLWGGQVLQYTGDGIKAAFGVQGLREDEAERAVRAGLQILDEATRHAERVQRELGVKEFGARVGVHTGPVLLGGGPEAERTAVGHAVHLAARMEQSAPIGQLRISDATWSQVRGLFRAEAQPPLFVKGHDEPLRTWLIKGVESGPEPAVRRGVDEVVTPMVGRDDELSQLLAIHSRMIESRQASSALVLGDAGVGKTRLRRELLATLGLTEGDAGLLQARANPSSPLQPYGLLRQLLTRWFVIRDDQTGEQAREQLLTGLSPWLADASQQGPRIGHLLGFGFEDHSAVQSLPPALLREKAFAALCEAVNARGHAAPLLLVLDDLHWADDASLDFVRLLLAPTAAPIFLLMLARPTLQERAGGLALVEQCGEDTLQLRPLSHADDEQLLDALLQPLPDPPTSLRQMLLTRAQGNPFFLEALVQMLIDDGVIDASTRPWQLHAGRLAALRVPPTLVAVLQARLDSLPADQLRALQNASIVGPVFWDDALRALDEAGCGALPTLQGRSLVVARETSVFADTAERAFIHQMLHETTYDTVLKQQRRDGHARAARWLRERVTDRASGFYAVIAEHYERAGDSVQALEYWDLAAEDARARYSYVAALQYYQRALAQPALTDALWRFQLLNMRETMLDRLKDPNASRALDDMVDWAERCDDDGMRASAAFTRMLEADRAGRPAEAAELAERILNLTAAGDATFGIAARAYAHGELAWLAVQRGDFEAASRHIADGIDRARAAARLPRRHGGNIELELMLHAIAIEALIAQGRYAAALTATQVGLAALEGRRATLMHRFNFLLRQSVAERHLGRLDESLATARRALQVATEAGVDRHRLSALQCIAGTSTWKGDFALATEVLDESESLAAQTDEGFALPTVLEQRGDLAMAQGQQAQACELWRRAAELFVPQERTHDHMACLCRIALIDLTQGRKDEARAAVEALLAETERNPLAQRRALTPQTVLACYRVLHALQDSRAPSLLDDLRVRMEEQLQSLPDETARERFLRVPHWREVKALLEAPARR